MRDAIVWWRDLIGLSRRIRFLILDIIGGPRLTLLKGRWFESGIIFSRILGGGEMFFLRLTLYTCAFYLCIALPIIIAELIITYRSGGFSISFIGRSSIVLFAGFWGLVWLTSFFLAFRKVFPFIWAKLVIGA